MKYMLDTDTCIYWLNGNEKIENKILSVGLENIAVSIINVCELYFGAFSSEKKEQNISLLDELFSTIEILQTTKETGKIFVFLKKLRERGQLINDADLLIASIALTHDCVLVTNNIKHFQRIENLKLENWME